MRPIVASNLFWYNVPFLDLLHASDQSYTLQTQTDTIFEVQRVMAATAISLVDVTTDGAVSVLEGQHYSFLTLSVTELDNGEKWSNEPIALSNWFGTAQCPLVIPQTVIWRKNASILFEINNNSTVTDMAMVYLTFYGRKLYD
jgi:hypothetical protein